MRKPTIAIVGAGNLARVLAPCLHRAGYVIAEVVSRDASSSRRRARAIAKSCAATAADFNSAKLTAPVIWICVTDDAITAVAKQLVKRADWRGKLVFHSSGASPSSILLPLQKRGAAIASVHPMNTFVATTKIDLRGVPFALEGDPAALRIAERVAKDLSQNGYIFRIRPQDKVLYHAMGSFASPLLVSLMEIAERVGRAARIKDPERIISRILNSTIANLIERGPARAFSGPINRGDIATIRKHLSALRRVPGAAATYRALARNAVERLPVGKRAKLKRLLQ